jgi:hypothetical protein
MIQKISPGVKQVPIEWRSIGRSGTVFLMEAGARRAGTLKTGKSARNILDGDDQFKLRAGDGVERARFGRHRYFLLGSGVDWRLKEDHQIRDQTQKAVASHFSRWQYDAPDSLVLFISDHRIKTRNIAGPRASKEPQIAAFVRKVLEEAFFHDRILDWRSGQGIANMPAAASHVF